MDAASAREFVLAMEGVTEHDHFGRGAYRMKGPKGKPSNIFMTLWIEEHRAVLMLSVDQQADLHARHPEVFFPVPNKWGANGATFVELSKANEELLRLGIGEALSKALKLK